MSPNLTSRLRRALRELSMILLGIITLAAWLFTDDAVERTVAPETPTVVDEWLYVNTDNVLFFMVDEGKCLTERKYSLLQVHEGEKVLVISRQDEWVEVEMEDQTRLFTHGCIHESMLENRDD